MRVLSVDPGYARLGVAVMEHRDGKEVLLYSSCIETPKNIPLPERLHQLGQAFEILLREHAPDAVAVETLFFNKNQKTAMAVAEARGIVLYLAQQARCSVHEFSPQQIKVAVTGYGNSDKKAVTEMVLRLVPNSPKKAHDDEYDAIAVGVTCLAHSRH